MAGEKVSLVFIPYTTISHLMATVKTAKVVADRDDRLSVTVIIMKHPTNVINITSFTENSSYSRINFVQLFTESKLMQSPISTMAALIKANTAQIKAAVAEIRKSTRFGGFVLDIVCLSAIDLAKELGAPAYLTYTSGAASLGLMLHLQSLQDDENQDMSEYENSEAAISIPTYVNPVPAKLWPSMYFHRETGFLDLGRRVRETKGIILNTFIEFESHAVRSLISDNQIPAIYPVGPILQDGGELTDVAKEILNWLDDQPDKSVVYLCFGSHGYFGEDQVKEIAEALENSGYRFLWSLRKQSKIGGPVEYDNLAEALPEGFLERTAGTGKVIGWAPQMAVLSHASVGGFVSHCGWNSTLESVWFGVPMATWPLFAEQKVNALQMVKDFGMAVDIKMDYMRNTDEIVPGKVIEKAIKELMHPQNDIRIKVREMSDKSRKVLTEGGSSYDFLGHLIGDIIDNSC